MGMGGAEVGRDRRSWLCARLKLKLMTEAATRQAGPGTYFSLTYPPTHPHLAAKNELLYAGLVLLHVKGGLVVGCIRVVVFSDDVDAEVHLGGVWCGGVGGCGGSSMMR